MKAKRKSIFDPPPPGACTSPNGHRFTVMSSRKGWKNCWYCGASAQVGR